MRRCCKTIIRKSQTKAEILLACTENCEVSWKINYRRAETLRIFEPVTFTEKKYIGTNNVRSFKWLICLIVQSGQFLHLSRPRRVCFPYSRIFRHKSDFKHFKHLYVALYADHRWSILNMYITFCLNYAFQSRWYFARDGFIYFSLLFTKSDVIRTLPQSL